MTETEEPIYLYLCDGRVEHCQNDPNSICYLRGENCRHTLDPGHAISKLNPNYPKTYFREDMLGCMVEHIIGEDDA